MNARRVPFAALALLLGALAAGSAGAAAPATIGYQGRLATSGGQPISGIVSITFRLYELASGGSALWTETQNNVVVDGGNLSVELGKVTALPASLLGRQLYIGVQLSGDTEMLPRPPLTAAPFALRAGSTFKNTIFVSAEGTPIENGTALLAALASAANATAQNPVAVELDAGTFDLGNQLAVVPAYVTLGGRSQEATTVTSSNQDSPLFLGSNTSAHDFTSRSTGTPSTSYASIGLIINKFGGQADNVRLERVTGISSSPSGRHWGIYACAKNSHISDVTGIGQGGQNSAGLTLDCDGATNNLYEGIVAYASGSTDDATGIFIGGGGVWRDFKVFLAAEAILGTVGLHVVDRGNATTALLSDVVIRFDGGIDSRSATGVLIDGANVDLERMHVNIDNAPGLGLSITGSAGSHVVRIVDSSFTIGVTCEGYCASGISLIDTTAKIFRTKVALRESRGKAAGYGIKQIGSQVGALELDHVDVTVGQGGIALQGTGQVGDSTLHMLPGSTPGGILVFGDVRISRSNLLVENNAGPPPATCVFLRGPTSIELYGNTVHGDSCAGSGSVVPTCAGNTKSGTGFLASTCP